MPRVFDPQVFNGHIDDGGRDAGFDQACVQVNHLQRRKNQRNAMRDRERSDNLHDLAKLADDDQGDQKTDVVVSQEDVLDTHFEKPPELLTQGVLCLRPAGLKACVVLERVLEVRKRRLVLFTLTFKDTEYRMPI